MRKITLMILGAMIMLTPIAAHASAEIHVTRDGKASVSGAKVIQISGTTFFTRLYWGDAFMRFTIKSNSTTKFLRGTSEATTIAEIKVGDLLDVVGNLEATDTLTMAALSIKNFSVQKEQSAMSGIVENVFPSAPQFTMTTKERGTVIVNILPTTKILKGSRTIDIQHVAIGDRIISASGDYDISTKTLVAQSVRVYVDPNQFIPQLFIGKLAEAPTSADAQFLKITLGKTTYTIFLNSKTTILRADRSPTTLQRFVVGDPIRIYGAIREVDEPQIDAEVIRNTNL